VLDLVYIAVTIVFFGLMVAYVAACARLGEVPTNDKEAL
jgi:hypothetical protein